jgi:hypothetical protein
VRSESVPSFVRGMLLVGAFALATSSLAQSGSAPFFESPHELSYAFGLELITSRLNAVEALDGEYGDYLEQAEKLLGRDFRRFGGTLAERDPGLAAEFHGALAAVIDAVEAGTDASDAVAAARNAQARAYAALINADLRASAGFTAMVVADLLLQDDGVAEAYEDAAEDDLWEFPNGYGALIRVKELWYAQLAGMATAEQQEDVEEMFEFLDTVVYPTVRPPDEIRGDPEEAEAATQRITGVLEVVAQADLYPSRDLGRLAEGLADMLAPSCEAYAAGNDDLGVEGVYAVRNPYRKHLRRLLDLIAPEIHEPAAELLDALISSDPPADRAAACTELHGLLVEARGVL